MRIKKLWLATIAVLWCSMTVSAYDFEVGGIRYDITSSTDLTVEVTSNNYSNDYSGAVEIPSTVTYNGNTYSVTGIGEATFWACSSLTSITIPSSVTSIGYSAFYNCSSLKTVINYSGLTIQKGSSDHGYVGYYADKVVNVGEFAGDYAFKTKDGVHNLTGYIGDDTELTLPTDYQGENYQIGSSAFYNCSSLTSITIPEGVTSIGNDAFDGCSSLTAVYINSLEAWCNIDFGNSSANPLCYAKNLYLNGELVTELTIPNTVTTVKDYAFDGCRSLTSITIPESVTSIGNYAFYNCSSLTTVTIPENSQLTSIGERAFSGCSSLTTVTIPENSQLTSIGEEAFYQCSSLTSITIPEGVTSIGEATFWACSSLTSITIPEGVTSIGDGAFRNCSSLTSITIPEGVTSIGRYAFLGCSSLTSITIPSSVTSIGDDAFSGCRGLTTVTILENSQLTSIENSAFSGCSGLTSITIPSSVTSIGEEVFYQCSSLTSIAIPEGVTSIGRYAFLGCSSLTTVTLPENSQLTSIGLAAFSGCSGLTSITIPSSVTGIGSYTFYDCSNLKTVINCSELNIQKGSSEHGYVGYYADRVVNAEKIIDDYAFKTIDGVHYLTDYIGDDTELTLPTDYQGENYQIGESAFSGCRSLTSITIPESVTGVESNAFYGCENLKTVINYSDLDIEKGSGSYGNVGYYAERVINIDEIIDSYAFRTINGICYLTGYMGDGTELTLPINYQDKSYQIGESAFSGCSSLISIVIPEGVTNIGSYAFYGCENLKTITNYSALNIQKGSPNHGYVAHYAEKVISESVSLDCTEKELYIGESFTLNASIRPAGKAATWSTTDDAVATVENGVIKAIAEGVATITLKVGESTATCMVTVNPAWEFDYAAGHLTVNADYIEDYPWSSVLGAVVSAEFGGTATLIGPNALAGCTGLMEVTIANSVTNIGNEAFKGCTGLMSINFSDQLTSIGSSAFAGCTGLTSIALPNSLVNIGTYAFKGCTGLISVDFGEGVKIIGDNSFENCTGLKSVAIPNSVRTIQPYVFANCDGLTNVSIPNSVTSIGVGAFADCDGLSSIDIPNSVTIIGASAFNDCDGMESLIIPISVTNIGDEAFAACDMLESVVIGDGVTIIGAGAFADCYSMNELTIGNSVTTIGSEAFSECDGLIKVVIPNSVTNISTRAFRNCDKLAGVTIGKLVREIQTEAFEGCVNLKTVANLSRLNIEKGSTRNGYVAYYAAGVYGEGVYFIVSTSELDIEESFTFVAMVASEDKHSVVWNTSDASVVAIDENGTVTALTAGTAIITATAGDKQTTCVVTVKSEIVEVSGLTLNQASATLIEGETLTLTATITPDNATDKTVTWSSSNNAIATVDVNGVVTAVAEGTAVITATAGNKTAVCVVTVIKNDNENEEDKEDENEKEEDEEEDKDAGIEHATLNSQHSVIYDLQGRRVLNTENLKGGVYIVNGKKVVMK